MDMQKRRPMIAGNWKMNKTDSDTAAFLQELLPLVQDATCRVVVCTPFTSLATAVRRTADSPVEVGAQNVHFAASGAYTGEISAAMLTDCGVRYVILGHSERRQYFGETDATVNLRLLAALSAQLRPIVCVGESLPQREDRITEEIIRLQVKLALRTVTEEQMASVTIAYEPIWAIGTGKTATAEQAQEVCAAIRQVLVELYGTEVAEATAILYGGSMNAGNAAELLAKPDIDGGLIGGASLKAADFSAIVHAASL